MQAAPIPENDRERLAAVRRYDILDTPPDGAFDRITELAARLCGAPIALVTIVDEDRIWFKSRYGLDDVTEVPRDPGLCASAICDDDPYVIEQARTDPRALLNPLVAGSMGLQFYAAVPLRTHDGYRLGTLCVMDRKPRKISDEQLDVLRALAAITVDQLELRLSAIQAVALERNLRKATAEVATENARRYEQEREVAAVFQTAALPSSLPAIAGLRFDAVYEPATADVQIGGDWYDAVALRDGRVLISIGDVAGHGLHAAVLMTKMRQSLRALALTESSPAALLQRLDAILRVEEPDFMITAFAAVLDPKTGACAYASAGHPPPVVLTAGKRLLHVDGANGLPLGLRENDEPPDASVRLEPGSLLVLYTDGLTEATHDLIVGERNLNATLLRGLSDPAAPARSIATAMVPYGAPDDVAILTVQFAPVAQPAQGP